MKSKEDRTQDTKVFIKGKSIKQNKGINSIIEMKDSTSDKSGDIGISNLHLNTKGENPQQKKQVSLQSKQTNSIEINISLDNIKLNNEKSVINDEEKNTKASGKFVNINRGLSNNNNMTSNYSQFPQLQLTQLNSSIFPSNNNLNQKSKQDGFTVFTFPNGSIFKGNIKNNMYQGIGYFKENEKIFTIRGEFRDDMCSGYGIIEHFNGTIYEGEWVNDQQEGFGIESYSDGSYFRGEFKNGKKNGNGEYSWRDGARYLGEFKENLFHGCVEI